MANLEYIVANKLTTDANAARASTRKTVLWFGALLTVVLFFVSAALGFIAGIATTIAFFSIQADSVKTSGAEGEDQVLSLLKGLPDGFTIFNQIDLPNEKSRTGVNEADLVVCGPSAIFVIEVKHNNGTITCNEASPQWSIKKVGRGGTEYGKEMRNPIAQTKNLIWLLGEYLKKTHSKPWIQGLVVFSNSAATVEVHGTPSMPILRGHELLPYLTSFKKEAHRDVAHRAIEQIAKLRATTPAS